MYLQQKLMERWRYPIANFKRIPVLFFMFCLGWMQSVSATTRYEAESSNLSNVSVSTTYSGYSGSGYVTGFTSEWSKITFGISNSQTQPSQFDIRYANGSGGNITNLALYIGSTKIQDLVFPATTNWSTWSTLTVYFDLPAGYQEVNIRSAINTGTSANIDYGDLTIGVANTAPGAFSQSTPSAASTGISTTPTLSWGSSANAASYSLVVSTSSSYTSPVVNVSNLTSTSYNITTALVNNTQYYWKVTAVNANGSTIASNAGISFTTQATPVAPGAFTQSAPASGATSVSTTPAFSWVASSGASTYTLVVSTSSAYTNPIINQSNISSTSYTSSTSLANNTLYYWKVTAVNGVGNTIATNAGISFTTSNVITPPPPTGEIYEAESINRANVTTATTYSGYSGSGYVTDFTSEWSFIKFEKSFSQTTPVQLNIRYANGTGATVTNLELYQGSQKIGDLSFPATASWSSWNVLSVTFSVPVGYQGISVEGRVNASQSVNIDYLELVTGSITILPGAFSQTSPAASAPGVSTLPTLTWGTSSNANSYSLVVATNSAFTNPIVNQTGITTTSYTIGSALANNTQYYWKVTAVNTDGTTNASNAGIAFTTAAVTPAPSAFTQTAPPSGGTGVSITPSFSWQTATNATSYTLLVSTSSTYANPVINVSNISTTTYAPGTVLSSSTQYYWKVTATNASGSTVATNAGINFTTGVEAPPSSNPGVTRDYWAGISGSSVSDLTSNSNYPNNPTSTSTLASFDAPRNVGQEYGQRIKGYLAPTVTGSYEFWIASDDDSELWLSTNDQPSNKVKIAYVSGWANAEQFDKYTSQKSVSISLTAGNYYYIEALQKDAFGDDHLTVAWKISTGTRATITSANLVTFPPVPVAQPGVFTQTAPASAATNVALTPNFTWGTSTDAFSYSLIVATNSSFTNPVINVTGLTTNSYTPSAALQGSTTYYWKVTAVNTSGTRNATNAGISFTTLVPPPPGAFTQTAPASGATNVNRFPQFTWASATNTATYSLVVATNSAFTSPVINVSGLTSTNYTHSTSLAGSTQYYWKVTAFNSSGSTVATNAGIAFTTTATIGTYYYVATTGVDAPDNGTISNPWRTLAYAASQVPANQNNTIYINPGTYVETQAVKIPVGVNVEGAGQSLVTITANGPIAPPAGVDQSSGDWKLWYHGSLIQLYSAGYTGGPEVLYGSPTQMVASSDGNQTLSGFTVDGHNKQVKAGIWVQNRNNVTMHHVTVNNCEQRGAIFTRSDMWWYEPLPDGKWMYNTTIHDCNFSNNGAQLGSESLGNLCIAGLDGADIYNLTIQDNVGYGIKFIMVGHYRNVKIHDCNITVNENDAAWGEKISIELWNLDQGNEVYNIVCNTWHSYVNHQQLTTYEPTGTNANNLKVYNVRMIDADGSSGKEAIEAALSGVQIYDCYIQDKGFGIAIWNGAGQSLKKNYIIRNNIFTNVVRQPQFGFGKSAGVFVPDAAQNIKIYNNVFDRMGNGLNLDGATGVEVRNNVFLNTQGADVENGSSVTFTSNLKYHTDPQKVNFNLTGGPTLGTGNITGNPGFKNAGDRWGNYYQPASSTSLVVNTGVNVGLPYNGTAPDIGKWEFSGAGLWGGDEAFNLAKKPTLINGQINVYPNPTKDKLTLQSPNLDLYSKLKIVNVLGQICQEINLAHHQTAEMDIQYLPAGTYFVILSNKSQSEVIQFIKE